MSTRRGVGRAARERCLALLALALFAVPALAAPPPERLAVHDEPRALREIRFQDEAGTVLTLEDFRGKVVVLNLWATWCTPCREEMPTLDALQAQLGGERFEVVALSIDRAGPSVVREFYQEVGIRHLRLYIDPSMRSPAALGVAGIPTTLVVDPDGRELARLVGPADWAAPDMLAYFGGLIEDLVNGGSD